MAIYASNPELRQTLDMIAGGYFSPGNRTLFAPIVDSLLAGGDHYMVLADYDAYVKCQQSVDVAYQDTEQWNRKAILNVAHIGGFFVGRLVGGYADEGCGGAPRPAPRHK